MPRSTPSALLLSAVAAMAFGTGCTTTVSGAPSADGVAPAAQGSGDAVAWVDQVCGSLLPFVRTAATPPEPSAAPDPASLVEDITGYLGDAEDAAGSAVQGMDAAGPSPVAGGDDVVERLDETLTRLQETFRDARTRIEGVDVNDRQALLSEVPAAVASLEELANMPNPMADLQASPELDRAGREAANCRQIEREFGG
ncbi:hypothetical protein [Pseudonocardia kunmingensis]|uniref:Secreted protein n=1 Tax=Pseudonocardia kunmingensis TaxID=630975 RepID=A0A543DAS2_9PSEU|nr:hypothetical protein [Pseudonocardia kunmingensis]TQM06431.1 hypothetical protein FB558_6685 [Pseudonocardia kunmingensis]